MLPKRKRPLPWSAVGALAGVALNAQGGVQGMKLNAASEVIHHKVAEDMEIKSTTICRVVGVLSSFAKTAASIRSQSVRHYQDVWVQQDGPKNALSFFLNGHPVALTGRVFRLFLLNNQVLNNFNRDQIEAAIFAGADGETTPDVAFVDMGYRKNEEGLAELIYVRLKERNAGRSTDIISLTDAPPWHVAYLNHGIINQLHRSMEEAKQRKANLEKAKMKGMLRKEKHDIEKIERERSLKRTKIHLDRLKEQKEMEEKEKIFKMKPFYSRLWQWFQNRTGRPYTLA